MSSAITVTDTCWYVPQARSVTRWWTRSRRRPRCSRSWMSSATSCPRSDHNVNKMIEVQTTGVVVGYCHRSSPWGMPCSALALTTQAYAEAGSHWAELSIPPEDLQTITAEVWSWTIDSVFISKSSKSRRQIWNEPCLMPSTVPWTVCDSVAGYSWNTLCSMLLGLIIGRQQILVVLAHGFCASLSQSHWPGLFCEKEQAKLILFQLCVCS